MANRQAAQRASQEQYFFEYVDQLDRHRAGRLALIVTLSGIPTARARQSTQNLVCDHIKRHLSGRSFEMFVFDRGDVAILAKDVAAGFIQDMAFGLVFQLQGEEFFAAFENGEADLCRLLDVEIDYKDIKSYAKAGLHKGPIGLPGAPMAIVPAREDEEDTNTSDETTVLPLAEKTPKLKSTNDQDPDNLIAQYVDIDFSKEEALQPERDPDAELETRRDELIQILDKEVPQIVMSMFGADEEALVERFLERTDEESREAYLPGILQETEQQLLTRLATDDPHLLPEHLAIAVQVQTLLSADFLTFDRMRAEMSILPRSLIVLGRRDVRANGDTFKFAREFVEGRGHQLALGGLTIPSVERVRLKASGFIFQFVKWDAFEASLTTKKAKAALREGVENDASAATVLIGCDDEEAIEFGREIGIKFFEGRAAAQSLFHHAYDSSSV